MTPGEALLRLLGSANIASRSGVYRQYDQQVQANTVVGPGTGDAAVLLLREGHGGPATRRGIAACTDGNSRMTWLDPFVGGQLAVAEACRNVSCVGAEPIALTDCLNFGNPERPEVYYQLEECIKGMADACRALDVPVVSGNVSLYNESGSQAIYPTPVVGALGLLEDVSKHCGAGFRNEGDVVLLLGAASLDGDASTLAGSEALETLHGTVAGQPALDLDLEARVQRLTRDAIRRGLLSSAHDCSEGGLAVALAESCILGGIGATITARPEGRWDAALFGEAPSRILVSLDPSKTGALRRLATRHKVPVLRLGRTTADAHLRIARLVNAPPRGRVASLAPSPAADALGVATAGTNTPAPTLVIPTLNHAGRREPRGAEARGIVNPFALGACRRALPPPHGSALTAPPAPVIPAGGRNPEGQGAPVRAEGNRSMNGRRAGPPNYRPTTIHPTADTRRRGDSRIARPAAAGTSPSNTGSTYRPDTPNLRHSCGGRNPEGQCLGDTPPPPKDAAPTPPHTAS